MKETTGQRIHRLRKEKGISAEKFGEMIGKNRTTVYRYESGEIENLPSKTLVPIAKALGVTPVYLLNGEEVEGKPKEYEFPTTLGSRIKSAREDRGMSIEDLAYELGLSINQVVAMENGINRTFNRELMIKLAHVLDVSASYFLNDHPDVDIGKNIEALRLMANISVHDMAIKTNTEVSRIIKVENGTPPTVEEIERVARFFKIPEQWIVNYDFSKVMNDERIRLAFQVLGLANEITKEDREQIITYARFILKK